MQNHSHISLYRFQFDEERFSGGYFNKTFKLCVCVGREREGKKVILAYDMWICGVK